MINRNKSELERIRRYHDPDDDAEHADNRTGYIKWFGIWMKEGCIFRIGFGLCFLMVAAVVAKSQLANRVAWLPSGEMWFELVFLGVIMVMSFTSFSMFYCGSMTYRRQIKEMDARMARRDNATPEEVAEVMRQTEKRLNRQSWLRTLLFAAALIILYPIFGAGWIFPWGGVVPYWGVFVVTLGLLTGLLYFRREIAGAIGRWLSPTRYPRA